MSRRKERLSTHISRDLHVKLKVLCDRPGVLQTDVVEAALQGFFSDERNDQRDATIIRRLEHVSRQVSRLERNDLVLTETIVLALRFMFSITPPLAPGDRKAALALSARRFEDFTDRLARQLSSGRRILEEALEDVIPEPGDFASLANLDADEPVPRQRRRRASNGEAGRETAT